MSVDIVDTVTPYTYNVGYSIVSHFDISALCESDTITHPLRWPAVWYIIISTSRIDRCSGSASSTPFTSRSHAVADPDSENRSATVVGVLRRYGTCTNCTHPMHSRRVKHRFINTFTSHRCTLYTKTRRLHKNYQNNSTVCFSKTRWKENNFSSSLSRNGLPRQLY